MKFRSFNWQLVEGLHGAYSTIRVEPTSKNQGQIVRHLHLRDSKGSAVTKDDLEAKVRDKFEVPDDYKVIFINQNFDVLQGFSLE